MARILFAWELGANLGHLGPCLALAEQLRRRGHEATFVIPDISLAAGAPADFAYVQAPVWRPRIPRSPVRPCSYAEIMHCSGFADRAALLALTRAWRQILRWADPEVTVFDHAPTALLAARELDTIRVLYGVGFSSPPRVSPLPSLRPWKHVAIERLQSSESAVLESINWVLANLSVERLGALHELFDVDEDFLCTFPELDHYAPRAGARYCGPVFHSHDAVPARWPAAGGKRLYVYLRPEMPSFRPVAHALANSPYSVLWATPGVDPDTVRAYETPSLKFVTNPVDLTQVRMQADAAVLYGSHGTAAAMLLAGVPMILCPNHVEQMLVARNVARLGACDILRPDVSAHQVRVSIDRVVEDASYRERADAFASRYAGFDPRDVVRTVAERIHQHCEGAHA